MAQVTVVLNSRSYQFGCEPGEEARLREIGRHVQSRVEDVARQYGKVGNDRLLAMAALLIADELFEARERLGDRKGATAPPAQAKPQGPARPAAPAGPAPAVATSGPNKSTEPSPVEDGGR